MKYEPLGLRVVIKYPYVSPDQMQSATRELGPFLAAMQTNHEEADSMMPVGVGLVMAILAFAPIPIFGVLWAWLLRGGLFLRLCGIAVVTRDGRSAARWRAGCRGIVAWWLIPTVSGLSAWMLGSHGHKDAAILCVLATPALFIGGTIWAIVAPSRGLQDRLLGTWLVPY